MTSSGSIVMVPYKEMQQLFIRFEGFARDTDKLWHESNNMLLVFITTLLVLVLLRT